jgi:GT2 family glycosyltransferase
MAAAGRTLAISAIVPTYNRREQLVGCLAALAAQTLPRDCYEIIVVDDGSTDGTREAVANLAEAGALRYHGQPNLGPAAARNAGLSAARGELVLFIGDDVIARARLLEEHVAAHQRYTDRGASVLGRLDWPDWRPRTALMEYVCGPGHLQFAYDDIRRMPRLDYRFFYTSNVSIKRDFLAASGELFDISFRHAAFEDTEFAYRLQRRGLSLHYADAARAVHDHAIDVESFVRREERAGEMAVALYCKHPELDHLAQVGPLVTTLQALDRLLFSPVAGQLIETATRADQFLRRTAAAIDGAAGDTVGRPPQWTALREDVWFVVFSAARTRGKVRALLGTGDSTRNPVAAALAAGVRELDYVVRTERQLASIATSEDAALLRSIAVEAARLRQEYNGLAGTGLAARSNSRLRRFVTRRPLSTVLRTVDVALESELTRWNSTKLLGIYRQLRGAVKRRLS